MTYVDGFLLPLPKTNVEAYRKMASTAGAIWMEHGALFYKECIIDHDNIEHMASFSKVIGASETEAAVFAFIGFKSREHRDEVNAKVMNDQRLKDSCDPNNMPFDCKRMAYGGFSTLVDL